jgi:cell pole-organizing protein PopZ
MTQPAKAQEPSMEEILASIRRIIADEEAKPSRAEPAPTRAAVSAEPEAAEAEQPSAPLARPESEAAPVAFPAQEASHRESQLDPPNLAEAMNDAPDAAFPDADAHSNDDFEDAGPASPGSSRPGGQLHAFEPPERLLSAQATAAVNSAFGTLAHTVLMQNARTLEDLVKEMLRPMLRTWLDDNLPNLVERLVRAEIERVSRGPSG